MWRRMEVEQGLAAAASSQFQHVVELVAFGCWRRKDGNVWLHAFLMLSGVNFHSALLLLDNIVL